MKTTHPLDEVCEAAALYALGDLTSADAQRFEQRLQADCPLCRAELDRSQRALEDLLFSAELVEPPPGLEERLLQRIGQPAPQPKFVRAEDARWKPIAPGVTVRLLHKDKTMLVRMEPGSRLPYHDHALEEQCFVLSGEIQDCAGNHVKAGDFIIMPQGSTHASVFTDVGAEFLVAYT